VNSGEAGNIKFTVFG